MSIQLDPVTGQPILGLTDPQIDQIPFNSQPVPYSDLTTQPTAGRTLVYPDDVPPTLANIVAQNGNDPLNAQTVHTDGSHALLVKTVGSSGGYSPEAYVNTWGQGGEISGTGNSTSQVSLIYTITSTMALTAVTVDLYIESIDTPGTDAFVEFKLTDDNITNAVSLFRYMVGNSTTLAGDGRYHYQQAFVPPIAIALTWPSGTQLGAYVLSNQCTWKGAFMLQAQA